MTEGYSGTGEAVPYRRANWPTCDHTLPPVVWNSLKHVSEYTGTCHFQKKKKQKPGPPKSDFASVKFQKSLRADVSGRPWRSSRNGQPRPAPPSTCCHRWCRLGLLIRYLCLCQLQFTVMAVHDWPWTVQYLLIVIVIIILLLLQHLYSARIEASLSQRRWCRRALDSSALRAFTVSVF